MKRFLLTPNYWLMGMVLVAITVAPAFATSITINNSSFETPTLNDGSSTSEGISGWTLATGGAGVWNPTATDYPGGVPDGNNVAYVFQAPATIYQITSATVTQNYRYSLQVYAGNDKSPVGNYTVQLVAHGDTDVVLAADSGIPPTGGFALVTLPTYTATDPAQYGKSLEIKLISSGWRLHFDDVKLDETLVPLPATLLLVGSGLVGLLAFRGRRKKPTA